MEVRYAKTEAGREEIRTRARGLPRTTRNLLLMIDGVRTTEYLLENLQGIGPVDIEQLQGEGLIEAVDGGTLDLTIDSEAGLLATAASPGTLPPGVNGSAAMRGAVAGMPGQAIELRAEDREIRAAIDALSYQQLYKLLSDQARERLGMIRGYKLTLEIERASDLEALRALAVQFVNTVREVRGAVVAGELRRVFERAT